MMRGAAPRRQFPPLSRIKRDGRGLIGTGRAVDARRVPERTSRAIESKVVHFCTVIPGKCDQRCVIARVDQFRYRAELIRPDLQGGRHIRHHLIAFVQQISRNCIVREAPRQLGREDEAACNFKLVLFVFVRVVEKSGGHHLLCSRTDDPIDL